MIECFVGLFESKGFDLYEYLDSLFVFSLIDMVVLYMQRSEKLFDQVVEALMLFTPVLQYKVMGQAVFE